MSYDAAMSELQQLLTDIQDGTISIDQLAPKIERANELVLYCRERLRQTEAAIQQVNPPISKP